MNLQLLWVSCKKIKKLISSYSWWKNVTGNKTFWKTIKLFYSDKILWKEKLTLMKKDEIVETDFDTAQDLSSFFSNIVINLKDTLTQIWNL